VSVKVRMLNGRQPGALFLVWKTPFVIGRHPHADLKVKSPEVSIRHCVLVTQEGRVWARDLASTNGTRVNGDPLAGDRELKAGDILSVGPAQIEVVFDAPVDILGATDSDEYAPTLPMIPLPPKSGIRPRLR